MLNHNILSKIIEHLTLQDIIHVYKAIEQPIIPRFFDLLDKKFNEQHIPIENGLNMISKCNNCGQTECIDFETNDTVDKLDVRSELYWCTKCGQICRNCMYFMCQKGYGVFCKSHFGNHFANCRCSKWHNHRLSDDKKYFICGYCDKYICRIAFGFGYCYIHDKEEKEVKEKFCSCLKKCECCFCMASCNGKIYQDYKDLYV